MSLSPTTRLQAINTMLTSIGEQSINSDTDLGGLQDASIASDILDNVSRSVQSKGWTFNTDLNVELSGDQTGQINLGQNVLRIDTTKQVRDNEMDIIERGRKLYDRLGKGYLIGIGEKVKVDIVKMLNFEDLPEPARRYITLRAARIFHDRVVGSGTLHQFYMEDENTAWRNLLDYEGEIGDYNIFDHYDVARVLDRRPNNTILA